MRSIGDVDKLRSSVFDTAKSKLSSFEPFQNKQHSLRLVDVDYEDPETVSKKDEKRAIIEGRTLARRLKGTWQLLSPDGKVIDQRRLTLAKIPYVTPRGTYVIKGTNYSLAHQSRLRPGVFTRVKQSGEIESHVNVARGYGHRYILDPKKGVFKLKWGQAHIPLYPVLRVLGATDRQIRNAWGDELFRVNAAASDSRAVKKLAKKLRRAASITPEDAIRNEFARMTLDPEITSHTLGAPFDKVNTDAILAATNRIVGVYRGESQPDDRDSMAFQRVVGPEDLIAESLDKVKHEARKAFWRASMRGSLRNFPTAVFDKGVQRAFYGTGLGSPIEEVNPFEILDQAYRVTRMGAGGIPSADSVPEESRQLQPSHFGYIDPVITPESGNIGVDYRMVTGTAKDKNGKLYSPFIDMTTGKVRLVSPEDLQNAPVAFPGEMESPYSYAKAIVNGRLRMVPKSQIGWVPTTTQIPFSPLANMIPFKSLAFGQRIAMGSRMFSQALPLVNREAQLVRMQDPTTGKSFASEYGKFAGAIHSPVSGVVKSADADSMVITDDKGKDHVVELYNNLPTNRKTFWHNEATVDPGSPVKKGQLLAYSNFTDKEGVAAPGLNARVAYLPARGYNYEDAVVVSKSFADRLKSEHMYQHTLDKDDATKPGLLRYSAIFPSELTKEKRDNFDESGVIKPGSTVEYGDPLILAVREKKTSYKLGRGRRSFNDASVRWEHHAPGVVVDTYEGPGGINVVVKSATEAKVGDKLSGLHGNKGVIAAIWDDDRMPQGEDGKPFELLLNPAGVISRANPAQIYEAALGKVARKTGKPIVVPDFQTHEDLHDWVQQLMDKHGIKFEEDITDPDTGLTIKDVGAGSLYVLKLHHQSEGKLQGRASGAYGSEGTPVKTDSEPGGKRFGMMEVNALLSHGAYGVLDDARRIRGQASPEYWRQVMQGYGAPPAKESFVYKKYLQQLRAAGINPVQKGTKLNVMALTAADVDELVGNREITQSGTVAVSGDKLTAIPGGLFGDKATGGLDGDSWSFIRSPFPIPNPVMEEPLRRILGLTEKEFRDVLAGRKAHNGVKGPEGLYRYVKQLNLDRQIEFAKATLRDSRRSKRDAALRKLRFLEAAKRLGQHPADWFWTKIPVLPPRYRPVSLLGSKRTLLVPDANYLYKEVIDAKNVYSQLKDKIADVGDERLLMYDAVKAVTGFGDPTQQQHREQSVKGILKTVLGTSPKRSVVHRKLLSARTDLSGRGVWAPDPKLGIDEIGLPEELAWKIYKPFIVRRLVRRGMSTVDALNQVKDQTDRARVALVDEMKERPVMWNRAPTLHKYGIVAAKPRLIKGSTIKVAPAVQPPAGGDNDGDAVQIHVPASDAAVKDALERMLPSKNLINPASRKVAFKPNQEYVAGLWFATKDPDTKKRVRVFRSKADAVAAFRRGDIAADQLVDILGD